MAKRKNIPGPTDTVPALLTPGEHVMNREAVALLGAENLERANKMGLAMRNHVQGFALGGVVAPEQKFASILRGNTTNEPIQGWNAREAEFKGFLDKNGLQGQSKIYDSASFNEKQNMMGRYNTNDGFKLQQTGPTAFGSTPEQVAELKAKNPAMQVYGMDSPQYTAYKERGDQAKANYDVIKSTAALQSSAPPTYAPVSAAQKAEWATGAGKVNLANEAAAKSLADKNAQTMADAQSSMDEMKRMSAIGVANNAANAATAQRPTTMAPLISDADREWKASEADRKRSDPLHYMEALAPSLRPTPPANPIEDKLQQFRGTLDDYGKKVFDTSDYNSKMSWYGYHNDSNLKPKDIAPGVYAQGTPEGDAVSAKYKAWNDQMAENDRKLKESVAAATADPNSGFNRGAWWNQPWAKPSSNLGNYDDGTPVNSVLGQERRNKGVYTQGLNNRPATSSASTTPIGADRESALGSLYKNEVAPMGKPIGLSEGGEVPYYYQPGARNVYGGRDLQPSPVAAIQPAAQIKNAGQTAMRDGSSYYGKPSTKPWGRPVDKASLPAPPVLIASQATNAIRGDVVPVQKAPEQPREAAREWGHVREEAPAPVPGVDLAPIEHGPRFRHSDMVDVGVQGFDEGGRVKNLDYIQPRPIQGWTPEQMIGEQGVEDVKQAAQTGKQFALGLGNYIMQQAGNAADVTKGTMQAARDRVSNRFKDTRYGAVGGAANVGLGVVEDLGRGIDAAIIKPLAKVGSGLGQAAYDKINPQQQFVQAPPQQTPSVEQPAAMNPETKAWGDRSIANIREGERNRMAAREKMQSMITDRQARAQGDLDARAAQQAQHQAWLDRPADYAKGSSPSYTQSPNGTIMRDGQATGLGQPAPRSREDEQAIRDRLTDTYTRHQLRNNPQALAHYAASRGSSDVSRYQADKTFENAGLDRAARADEMNRSFGIQERGQQFVEDKYNEERGDGQSTRKLADYVAGLELAARQGDEKAINALKTWMALNTKPKTYEQAKEKLTDANGNVIERTVGSFDNQTGAITKAPGAYTPQDYADFYGKLLSKFGGDQERAMQEYASFFAKNQG